MDKTGLRRQCDRQLITTGLVSPRRRIVRKPWDSSSHLTPWRGTVTFRQLAVVLESVIQNVL